MRPSTPLIAFALACLTAVGLFFLSVNYFRSGEVAAAEGRLSLYRSTVVAELERFSHLTYVLARDPVVVATATGGDRAVLNARLAAFAGESGLDAIYLISPGGETIAASNAATPVSFVGQNYGFRPYFQVALSGEQGRFYGIGATTGLPGYFIADAVRGPDGDIVGVIAIKLDLSKLEGSWRGAAERVMLVNRDGVVLLSSDPGWRYRVLTELDAEQRARIEEQRQFPGQALQPLDWSARTVDRAELAGAPFIHLTSGDLPHAWTLHYFADEAGALTRAWLVTGGAMGMFALWVVFDLRRRTRAMGVALRKSEAEEAQLRQANERLAHEIDERRTAERRLKRTQGELERAGRLAALGQLAASVTHELGQPIAAMKNHLAAAEISGAAPQAALPGLVTRMEGITRQLKFFARTEGDPFGPVDLAEALRASLALVQPNMDAADVAFTFNAGAAPVVQGNALRIEQVMTNLLRNAVDALDDSDDRTLDVSLGQSADQGWFEVRDTGHGLGDATLSDLQEPFMTTRESGRGMGLGLAISAGIVAEHGGTLSARNGATGGAVFRVELPLAAALGEAAE